MITFDLARILLPGAEEWQAAEPVPSPDEGSDADPPAAEAPGK